MDLKIFDVEHGSCALLECDDNTRLMIDAGHNGATGWRPGQYLNDRGITALEMLAVTNYDEDHVSGIADLLDKVDVKWLLRNRSVTTGHIHELKAEHGMGPGIERLVYEIDNVYTGDGTSPKPPFKGLERQAFWNKPEDFDDSNNLSAVYHLKCNGRGILFPGDIETDGWLKLMEQPPFLKALSDTQVLVASHHGRENGCCEEIFEYASPYYIVISDKGYEHETQETMHFYRRYATGGPFRDEETRKVLTTRNDGRIGFTFNSGDWAPY